MSRNARHAALLLIAIGGMVAAAGPSKPQEKPVPKEKVVIGGETFELELAADDRTRRRGLAGRDKIDDHGGMLFVYRHAWRRSFWMKDCLVDMDVLFLDSRGRIVRVHEMKAEPPQKPDEPRRVYERRLKLYGSSRPMQFAIELKAGSIDRLDLEPGPVIELDLPRLKKLAR